MANKIRNNIINHRYELEFEDKIVFATYKRDDQIVSILHVEAPPELRGTSAAGKLMEAIVQTARRENLKIKPICPYAIAWLQRHKEAADVLA